MKACVATALGLSLALAAPALGASPRERAVEQIPELMGRILESQEAIREREAKTRQRVADYDRRLEQKRKEIERASSEQAAAEALVDYVEAYASRLDEQKTALSDMKGSLVRMRADARELEQAAERAGAAERETPEERRRLLEDHYQGLGGAMRELATRLDRPQAASTAGAVLEASWASQRTLPVPVEELGPKGAARFARKVEGLYARFQARENQVRSERRNVRRLLDVLIERQLARRLDTLFAGGDELGLAAVLGGSGSEGWSDLSRLVGRTLGLPEDGGGGTPSDRGSMESLDFFAQGDHRN